MNTPLCQAHAVENQWITAVFLIATCQHQCHSLWRFIGPQQGHCSAVSSSILGDWWTRPCPGLKGTLSPPMKREISLLVPLTCPAQSKKSTAQHISAFSLCSAVQPAYMFRLLPFSARARADLLLLVIGPAARDGYVPERRQIELEKHFYMVTVSEQGAIYRLLN